METCPKCNRKTIMGPGTTCWNPLCSENLHAQQAHKEESAMDETSTVIDEQIRDMIDEAALEIHHRVCGHHDRLEALEAKAEQKKEEGLAGRYDHICERVSILETKHTMENEEMHALEHNDQHNGLIELRKDVEALGVTVQKIDERNEYDKAKARRIEGLKRKQAEPEVSKVCGTCRGKVIAIHKSVEYLNEISHTRFECSTKDSPICGLRITLQMEAELGCFHWEATA